MALVKIKEAFSSFVAGETVEVSDKLAKRFVEKGRALWAGEEEPCAPSKPAKAKKKPKAKE